ISLTELSRPCVRRANPLIREVDRQDDRPRGDDGVLDGPLEELELTIAEVVGLEDDGTIALRQPIAEREIADPEAGAHHVPFGGRQVLELVDLLIVVRACRAREQAVRKEEAQPWPPASRDLAVH